MKSPMAIQVVTELPYHSYYNYPIDIQIRIRPSASTYTAEIYAESTMMKLISIDMSSDDLASCSARLRCEIQSIVTQNEQIVGSKSRLLDLAKEGHDAFIQIFNNERNWMVKLVDEITRRCVPAHRHISIQITSKDFLLPWELIYPFNPSGNLSFQHFWGMNYVISRDIIANKNDELVFSRIQIDDQPNLGLLVYNDLPSVKNKAVPFFKRLDKNGRIRLLLLDPLNPDKEKQEEIEKLKQFLEQPLDIAHFACHAIYEKPPNERLSSIFLDNQFPIELREMDIYNVYLKDHPLIVMNACEMGNMDPNYTSYFARALLACGARGVVATECEVPDDFAADFTEQLYTHLLAGKTLGESILLTRRYFWEKHKNPSGLLYSIYGSPSIQLHSIGV